MVKGLSKITNNRQDCDMVVSVVTSLALCLHLPIFSTMSSIEPPDRSILKEHSQFEFYISALERWVTIAKVSGVKKTLLADILLTHAFKQAPKLCKEMVYNFNNSKGDNNGGNQKAVSWLKEKFSMNKHADMVKILNLVLNIIRAKSENYAQIKMCLSILLFRKQASWLKEKFGMNKHEDMVKVLNKPLNITRTKTENLVDYITRFKRNYAEVKKLGRLCHKRACQFFP